MSKELYANARGARLIEVIECQANEGEGTIEDPIQRVTYYYKTDGSFIGCTDTVDRQFKEGEYPVNPQEKEVNMKKIISYKSGDSPPDGSAFLSTVTQIIGGMWIVQHYFLVDVAPTPKPDDTSSNG